MKNTVLKEQPITCSEVTRSTASEEEKRDDQHHFRPQKEHHLKKRGPHGGAIFFSVGQER